MAIPVDEIMTLRPHPLGRSLVLCASVLSVALATGCTSDSGGPNGPSAPQSSPGQQRKHPSETSDQDEERLGEQVEEALGTEEVGDNDPLFVEAGLERVSDGFHTEPELARGRSYRLSVACGRQGKDHPVRSPEGSRPPDHGLRRRPSSAAHHSLNGQGHDRHRADAGGHRDGCLAHGQGREVSGKSVGPRGCGRIRMCVPRPARITVGEPSRCARRGALLRWCGPLFPDDTKE